MGLSAIGSGGGGGSGGVYFRGEQDEAQRKLELEQLKASIAKAKNLQKEEDLVGSRLDSIGKSLATGGASTGSTTATPTAESTEPKRMDEKDRLAAEFAQQKELMAGRAGQEENAIKLKAKLDEDRRKSSLSAALGSLSRFR